MEYKYKQIFDTFGINTPWFNIDSTTQRFIDKHYVPGNGKAIFQINGVEIGKVIQSPDSIGKLIVNHSEPTYALNKSFNDVSAAFLRAHSMTTSMAIILFHLSDQASILLEIDIEMDFDYVESCSYKQGYYDTFRMVLIKLKSEKTQLVMVSPSED